MSIGKRCHRVDVLVIQWGKIGIAIWMHIERHHRHETLLSFSLLSLNLFLHPLSLNSLIFSPPSILSLFPLALLYLPPPPLSPLSHNPQTGYRWIDMH
jgi:hypothetical protein